MPVSNDAPKFSLKEAISIINFKNKWSENKKDELVKGPDDESTNYSTKDDIKQIQAATDISDLNNIVHILLLLLISKYLLDYLLYVKNNENGKKN